MYNLMEALLTAIDENTFMLQHAKEKVRKSRKVLNQFMKLNGIMETQLDISPFGKEHQENLDEYNKYKEMDKKLNKIYKILCNEKNSEE